MIDRAVILAVDHTANRSMLTYNRAHAMLPALGKPLVARVMDRLHRIGIRRYTIVVGENEGPVTEYLNTHWQPDVNIDFVFQSANSPLSRILATIAGEYRKPFLVCGYNSFTHTQFPESILRHHDDFSTDLILAGATTTLSKAQQHYFAVMDGQRVRTVSATRPTDPNQFTLIDLAVCGSNFIDYLTSLWDNPTSHQRFLDIAGKYIQSGGSSVLAESSWVLQIEADRDLLTLNKHLLDEAYDAHILSELPYTVQIVPPVRIDPQVSVGQGAKIGPHVYLERGCSIGHEVVLRNAVILARAKVPARKSAFDTVISTRGPIP